MNNTEEEEFRWLEVDLSDILFLLRRHFLLLLVFPAIGLIAAVALSFTVAPVYQAQALFYVKPNFDQDFRVERATTRLDDDDSLRSIAEVFVSKAVILRMVDRLDLRNDVSFLPELKKGPLSDIELVDAIEGRYKTKLRAKTRLVELHVEDYSPERATQICQVLKEEFLAYMGEDRLAKEKQVRDRLVQQAEATLQQTLISEGKLKQFRSAHSDTLLEQDSNAFHERILEQSSTRNMANSERLRLEGLLTALESIDSSADPQQVFQILDQQENTYLYELLTMRAVARSNMAEAQNRYTSSHPEYKAARSRMIEVEEGVKTYAAELKDAVKSEYESALEREKSLEGKIATLKEGFIQHKSDSANFRGLKEEIDLNWNTHSQLQRRIMALDIDPEVAPSFMTQVEHPLYPDDKSNAKILVWAAVGCVCGGLLALVVIFWRNREGLPFTSGKQPASMLNGTRILTEFEFPTHGGVDEKIAALKRSSFIREVVIATRGERLVHFTSAVQSPEASMISSSYAKLSAQNGIKTIILVVKEAESSGGPIVSVSQNLSMLNVSYETILNYSAFITGLKEIHKQFDRVVIDTANLVDREAKLAICETSGTTIVAVEGKGGTPRSFYHSFMNEIKSRTVSYASVYFDVSKGSNQSHALPQRLLATGKGKSSMLSGN